MVEILRVPILGAPVLLDAAHPLARIAVLRAERYESIVLLDKSGRTPSAVTLPFVRALRNFDLTV